MTNEECIRLIGFTGHCKGCPHKHTPSCKRLKGDDLDEETVQILVEKIVEQAAEDLREYRRMLRIFPRDEETRKLYETTRAFFLSDYFEALTDMDGSAILEQLERGENDNGRTEIPGTRNADERPEERTAAEDGSVRGV